MRLINHLIQFISEIKIQITTRLLIHMQVTNTDTRTQNAYIYLYSYVCMWRWNMQKPIDDAFLRTCIWVRKRVVYMLSHLSFRFYRLFIKQAVNSERHETTVENWWRQMWQTNSGSWLFFVEKCDNLALKISELFSYTRRAEWKTEVDSK